MFDGSSSEIEAPLVRGRDKYGRDRGMYGYRRPSELTANDLDLFRRRYADGASLNRIAQEFGLSGITSVHLLIQQLQLPKRVPEVRTKPLQWELALEAVVAGCVTADEVAAKAGIPPANASAVLGELVRKGKCVRTGHRVIGTRTWVTYAVAPPQPEPVLVDKYVPLPKLEREVVWTPQMEGVRRGIYQPRYAEGFYFNNRAHWTASDKVLLEELVRCNVPLLTVADMLGRSPERIKEARIRFGIDLPFSWRKRRKKKAKAARRPRTPLLSYPYITKARDEHADLLAVNRLVEKAYPEHMRADICQEIMLALLEGIVTLDGLTKAGVRKFVAQWNKHQGNPYGTKSLDGPRYGDEGSWHDTLSSDHELWTAV